MYRSWASLCAAIDNVASPEILKQDVAPVGKKILGRRIKSDIYDAYTPRPSGFFGGRRFYAPYRRRKQLLSENYMATIIEGGNLMTITSFAPANKSIVRGYSFQERGFGAFLKLLESGNMGIWKNGFPRPAVSNTQKEFASSSEIKGAIESGIKRVIES